MATLDVSQPTLVPGTHSTKNITMPADVCGYIIAFLDDSEDPRTILACTLVSRSLLPIARFKLFRSISFKHERSWSLFKVFLSPAAPSHIAPYLKTVEELHIYPHSRDPWFSEILVECSEYLTGVKRISLRSIEWTPAWRSSLSSITPYVSLEVLQINPGVFDDVEQLYLLLSAFPTLPHLILDCADPWFKTNSGHDLHKWPGFQPLTTLEFRRYKMVRWLGKLGYLGHLKSLTWCGEFRAVQCKWRALSEAIDGSSLLSLCCDVQNRVYFNMSQFTCLTTLKLRFPDRYGNLSRGLALLRQMCASLSSPCLEKLHFFFSCELCSIPTTYTSLANLRAVDNIFSRLQFSRLSDVTFEYKLVLLLKEEPATFSCLMGTSPDSTDDEPWASLEFLPGNNLPNDAYLMDKVDSIPRLSSSYLETFLHQRAEGALRQIRDRGILTNKVAVQIVRPRVDENGLDIKFVCRFTNIENTGPLVGEYYESEDEDDCSYDSDVDGFDDHYEDESELDDYKEDESDDSDEYESGDIDSDDQDGNHGHGTHVIPVERRYPDGFVEVEYCSVYDLPDWD